MISDPVRFAISCLVATFLGASAAAAYTQSELDIAFTEVAIVKPVLEAVADDSLEGRDNDTPGSLAAQALLISKLREISDGIDDTETGDDAYKQTFPAAGKSGTNLFGVIPGRELPNEYVIIGAHYDHLGPACFGSVGASVVCNGATDNAAGVAQVMAIGRAIRTLPEPPRRTVVLALWDAEEDGLLGSLYYRNNPLLPVADTKAYINFDIQGANLLPSARNLSFAIGAESGGDDLLQLVEDSIATETLDTRQLHMIFGQGRSDYQNFWPLGIPTLFFSDSNGPCYHTSGDEASIVDFVKLRRQTRIAFRVVLELAEGATTPGFVDPSLEVLTYSDVVTINDAIQLGLSDLELFSPGVQTRLQELADFFEAIVVAGPGAFDPPPLLAILNNTAELIALLTTSECDGFLAVPEPASTWQALVAVSGLGCLARLRRLKRRAAR